MSRSTSGSASPRRGRSIWCGPYPRLPTRAGGVCGPAHPFRSDACRASFQRSSSMLSGGRHPSLRPSARPGSVCAAGSGGPTHAIARKRKSTRTGRCRGAFSSEKDSGSRRKKCDTAKSRTIPDSIRSERAQDPTGRPQDQCRHRRISRPESPGESGHGIVTGNGNTCQARDNHDMRVHSCSHPRVRLSWPNGFSTRSEDPWCGSRLDELR